MRILLATSALALAAAPVSAFAVDYLSAEQAQALIFPEADAFEARPVTLSASQMQALEAQGVRARSAGWRVVVARRGTTVLGHVVFDDVIGKSELIGYAVGLALDGTVRQVEVLSYRESHGQEIRLAAWRKQFVGKGAASSIKLNDDVANISGATLSCAHVTEGVRRIVAVVALARRSGTLSG